MENIKIWSEKIFGYQLLDSGEKEKLEEIGGLKIKRSEPRAWWRKTVDSKEYQAVGEKQKKELEEIIVYRDWETDRKSTRLNSSHLKLSRMPSSA